MNTNDLFWFLGTFVIIYLFYLIFNVLGKKEYNSKHVPVELKYLIKKFKLDMSKIKYQNIMHKIALVSAFDIAFTATFVFKFIKNIFLRFLIGVFMLVPLIIITFNIIGKYYQKKGMIKNVNKKN